MFLSVAIDTPLRRTFDYRCPASIDPAYVQPGTRLWVPFGRRRLVGILLEYRDASEVPADKLKPAIGVVDTEPTFDSTLLQFLRWSADYYRHPIGEVLAAALPGALREGASLREEHVLWRVTEQGRSLGMTLLSARARKQRAVFQALLNQPVLTTETLLETSGASREVLRQLQSQELIEQFTQPVTRAQEGVITRTPLVLNTHQQDAVERVRGTLGQFASHLLYGVTGSGKTEVYLQLIDEVLKRDEQALVLVPEIGLTPQLLNRFRARFATTIAVLHSGLNETERLNAWRSAREGAARVIIGTRSAVFVPLARPGLIVVDEEHDASFKQHEGFRYSARDLAIVRAQRLNIPVLLGSATPSLETLARAQKQPQCFSRLPVRAAANARVPTWTLIDMRKSGQTQGIATPVVLTMRNHLQAGGQVMLFLNRRGYAPVLFCPSCGWGARCKRCDAHLTVHQRAGSLICHHCGAEHARIDGCPECFADVKPVGQGTERIEEAITDLFPNVPLARLDRDSTRRKGELEAVLERVSRDEISILVGTQMLTKGHDFPKVTLVVVLNADQGLFSTDFRASERLAQTIVQVAGRAGRAERPGEVMIQTEYPEHPLLNLLLSGGYDAFAEGALAERDQCRWPPFARLALLRAEATTARAPFDFLNAALQAGRKHAFEGIKLLGPAPAVMERRAGRHRAQLLVHASGHGPLQKFLHDWLGNVDTLPEAKRVRWSIDVDPAELF